MPTLIDSSVLIDALNNHPTAAEYLVAVQRRDVVLSVTPVRTEVLGGMRDSEVRRTFDLLGLIAWIDVTTDLADMAGALQRRYHPGGSGISVVDYLLAAAAIQLDGEVATQNVRDFPMFPGLQAPY